MYKKERRERVKKKQRKEGWVVGRNEKDDTKKELEFISVLLCVTDYAEELRFYLIHMTEVRETLLCVYICLK